MLTVDPSERPSAADILESPLLLKNVRNSKRGGGDDEAKEGGGEIERGFFDRRPLSKCQQNNSNYPGARFYSPQPSNFEGGKQQQSVYNPLQTPSTNRGNHEQS